MTAQLENGYIRIANEIWDEIIRRDFTKRQNDILLFVWRLSYGCKKKSAIIPKLQDFDICGVSPTNITKELKHLAECKVLKWDRVNMIFEINKNYEFWQISPVKGWNADRFKELIGENLKTYQINKSDLLKQEVLDDDSPTPTKDEGVSKDSIKDIQETEEENFPKTAMDAYRFSFNKIMYTGHIQGYVLDLLKRGFTDAFIREVFLEMGARGIGADEKYMRKMTEDWISNGIYTRIEAERRKESKYGLRAVPDKTKVDPELESRKIEIARNKWIEEGNDPSGFVYKPASGD